MGIEVLQKKGVYVIAGDVMLIVTFRTASADRQNVKYHVHSMRWYIPIHSDQWKMVEAYSRYISMNGRIYIIP